MLLKVVSALIPGGTSIFKVLKTFEQLTEKQFHGQVTSVLS